MLSHLKNVHLKILERVQRHANPKCWYGMANNCASGIGPVMGDFTLDVVTAPSLIHATISTNDETLYLTREKV